MVKLSDVAKKAGVSPSTVSRCLRKDITLSISTDTEKRILEAAKALGYTRVPNASKRQYSFLIINKDSHFQNHVDNCYYYSIREGIETAAARTGDICRFLPISQLREDMPNYDGALIVGNYPEDQMDRLRHCIKTDSWVFVGKLSFLPEGIDTVTYDVRLCVRMALDRLYRAGIRSFVFMEGRDKYGIPPYFSKMHHIRDFLAEHPDMTMSEDIMTDDFGSQSGYEAFLRYLDRTGSAPEAVFAGNDPLAVGILKALHERGHSAGSGGVNIVSLNGDSTGEWTSPQLTSVDVHGSRMGTMAFRLLRKKIQDPDPSRIPCMTTLLPVLCDRGSVRACDNQ